MVFAESTPMIVRILAQAAFIYLAMLIVMFFMQRSLMYFPDQTRPDPRLYGAEQAQVVSVTTADGLELQGWYFAPLTESKPTILLFHGNAEHYGTRAYKIPFLLREGYGVLLAGYRGYGGNPGKPSEQGLYADARAYLDWLGQRGTPLERIVLYGESLGSGVAVQMATEYDVAGIVLEAPYSATVDVARGIYWFIPVDLLMRDQFPSRDKIGDVSAPVLMFHGGRDKVIPVESARRLYAASNQEHTIFIESDLAGHNDLFDHGAALHILEFLRSIEDKTSKSK